RAATSYAPDRPAATDARIQAMDNAFSAQDLRSFDTRLVAFGTRNDFSDTLNSPSRGVFAARDWIRAQFEEIAKTSGGRMTVRLDTFTHPKTERTPRDVVESSVIATLKGEVPGPTYVMSSHFDDCNGKCTDGQGDAPGADDNGSGTSAVIEAAKVMAHTHFRGTIIFATFDGEELGLWGSEHFANELKANGTQVVADLNNDIIGTPNSASDGNEVRIFSEALPAGAKDAVVNLLGTEDDSPSRELARFVKATGEQYVSPMHGVLIYRADRFLRGGDQQSFNADGFPAIRFVEIHEDFQHQHQDVRREGGVQYGDLPQYLDFNYLARITKMNVAALAALALGPEEPVQPELLTQHLTNDSTLRWKPAPGASTYQIVWRETTSPVWQYAKNVGDAMQATVPVSKDNYILGVRSVDANGLYSPVVYPTPVRK
ncbi:MAG TPA: M20/M25/M40 family metallo-hydrolase, partial [Candidatus Baltobacteraceae bacterium]|nr:M20/M25/M40 family metallo-hydrolase [Candidatus Baltobacteraceae bacterium]